MLNNIKPITTSIALNNIRSLNVGLTLEVERLTELTAELAHETAILKQQNERLDGLRNDYVLMELLLVATDATEIERLKSLLGW